jgi:hypothetical protein
MRISILTLNVNSVNSAGLPEDFVNDEEKAGFMRDLMFNPRRFQKYELEDKGLGVIRYGLGF